RDLRAATRKTRREDEPHAAVDERRLKKGRARGYYFFAVCSLCSNARNSSLLILPSLLVSASDHLLSSFGSIVASLFSMKPSLFLSSLANSAALSSPARAGAMVEGLAGSVVVVVVDGFCVWAPAGKAVMRPAAPRIDNTKPERTAHCLVCSSHLR